jgi:hypothetical protein
MCFTCSTIVNYDPESVEKTRNDFTECSKYLYATPPNIKIDPYFNLEKARELFNETEKDYVTFIKAHYLYGGSYRPYAVQVGEYGFEENVIYTPPDKSVEQFESSSSFLVTRFAFLAHYKLRLANLQLIDVLQRAADKKRRRRLQYKSNKRNAQAQP